MSDQNNNLLILPVTDDSDAGGQIGVPRTIKASTDVVKLGAPMELTHATAPLKLSGPLQAAAGSDLKLVGDDNVEIKLGDDAGAAQFKVLDSQGVVKAYIDSDGHAQLDGSLTVDGTSHFQADVSIDGDLDVTGSIVARSQIDVLIHDSYFDLGFGNLTASPQPGGFTIQMARTSGFIAGKVTDFPSTSTFVYAQNDASNASLLVAGMVIAISELPSEHAEDEGLFVVASVNQASFPQTVTIESSPMVNLPWAQTAVTVGTPDVAGVAFQTALAVVSVADGVNFKDAESVPAPIGSLVTGYIAAGTKALWQADGAYTGVGAGSTTMQDVYENGSTITTDAANGDVTIAGTEAFVVSASGGIETNSLVASADISAVNFDASGDVTAVDGVFSGQVSGASADFTGAMDAASSTLSGALNAASATLSGNLGAVDGIFSGNLEAVDATLSGDLEAVGGTFSGNIGAVDGVFSGNVDAVDATLTGNLEAVGGTFSGNVAAVDGTFSGDLAAVDADLSGNLEAVGGTFSGNIAAVDGTFSGDLAAVDAVLSGNLEAVGGTFSGNVAAVDGDFSGDVSGVAGDFSGNISAVDATLSGDLAAVDAVLSGDLSAAAGTFSNGLSVSGAVLDVNHSVDVDLVGAFAVDGNQAVSFGASVDVASFSVDAVGAISLDAGAASDFTAAADLTIESTGAGISYIKSAVEVEIAAPYLDVNASGAIELDAADDAHFRATGHSLSLQTITSGELDLTAAGLLDINAAANLDIDVTGDAWLDATAGISLDAGAASNFSTSAGDLTLAASGVLADVIINASDVFDVNAASMELDATGAISLGAAAASDFTVAGDLTIESTGAGITDLKSAAEVQVSTLLLDVNASGAAQIDAAANSWFKVAGAQLELQTTGSGELDLTSAGLMDVNAGADLDVDVTGAFFMDSTGAFSIDGVGASNVTTAGNLALQATGAGATMSIASVSDMSLRSSGGTINLGDDAATGAINIASGASATGARSILIGTGGTGAKNVTIGNSSVSTSGTYIQAGSTGGVNIATLNQSIPVNIATGTFAGQLNIGTGTASQVIFIGTGAGQKGVQLGSTNTTSATTIQSGTNAMTFTAGGAFDVNAAGAVTIDSSAGTISIGADNVNQDMNIGTGGTRFISIGTVSNTRYITLRQGARGTMLETASNYGMRGFAYLAINRTASTIADGLVVALQVSPAADSHLPQVVLASAGGVATVRVPFGAAQNAGGGSWTAGSNALVQFMGCFPVKFEASSAPAGAADVGKAVYLSATAGEEGKARMAAPTASGATVQQLGYLARGVADASSNWYIVWRPQFIALIP